MANVRDLRIQLYILLPDLVYLVFLKTYLRVTSLENESGCHLQSVWMFLVQFRNSRLSCKTEVSNSIFTSHGEEMWFANTTAYCSQCGTLQGRNQGLVLAHRCYRNVEFVCTNDTLIHLNRLELQTQAYTSLYFDIFECFI